MGDGGFVKRRAAAPAGFFEVEAAGLRWLAAAAAGPRVVRVLDVGRGSITLEWIEPTAPTAAAAEGFGRALARLHDAGAPWFGSAPQGWDGDGYIADLPLPHVRFDAEFDARADLRADDGADAAGPAWGAFYARYRLEPYLRAARERGALGADGVRVVEAVCARLEAGDRDLVGDPGERPARLHGDLWSGNVLWSRADAGGVEAVLIDPAAHGGHRETDLGMLALFGLPHLAAVLAGYEAERPLAPGWRDRVALHQLFPLLVHAALFGGGYGAQSVAAAGIYA